MRASLLLLAACLALAAGRDLVEQPQKPAAEELVPRDIFPEEQADTVLLVDERADGSLRVTGMLQNFRLDDGFEADNAALDRPRASFLDLAWSSWVDERLEVFDLLQALLAPRPPCPHKRPGAGSLDTGMVSYLASSRFGPAILTTYAQSFLDEEEEEEGGEWDYDSVRLPEDGLPGAKSYAEAELLEGLSADADRAFEREARSLGQAERADLGFFGANLRQQPEQAMWLDGDAESLQPSMLAARLDEAFPGADGEFWRRGQEDFDRAAALLEEVRRGADGVEPDLAPRVGGRQLAGLALFVLLAFSCVFVWLSLIRSCCRMGRELRERRSEQTCAARKLAQKELLVPLAAEGAAPLPGVELAAGQAPAGTYYAPAAAGYKTVAVPLLQA